MAENTNIEWGASLEGNLLKEWNLPGDTPVRLIGDYCSTTGVLGSCLLEGPYPYQLPASHPAYTVQAWNEAHPDEEPFVPWCGGDEAPGDWDGDVVMRRTRSWNTDQGPPRVEEFSKNNRWKWLEMDGDKSRNDIIGYRRRKEATPALVDCVNLSLDHDEPVAPPGYVLVKQMTEDEIISECHWASPSGLGQILRWARSQGIILPETLLDRFARAHPHLTITDGNRAQIEAALAWERDA